MTFIDEGVLQSIPCKEQMQHSISHFRNQSLGKKCMREEGTRVERERGREREKSERMNEERIVKNLLLGCSA